MLLGTRPRRRLTSPGQDMILIRENDPVRYWGGFSRAKGLRIKYHADGVRTFENIGPLPVTTLRGWTSRLSDFRFFCAEWWPKEARLTIDGHPIPDSMARMLGLALESRRAIGE